jgi:hypothetical protein
MRAGKFTTWIPILSSPQLHRTTYSFSFNLLDPRTMVELLRASLPLLSLMPFFLFIDLELLRAIPSALVQG